MPDANSPLVLVCGGDDNFAMPMTVMLFSLLSHLQEGLAVHLSILDNGLKEGSKQNLERVLRQPSLPLRQLFIEYHSPDTEDLSDLATKEWLGVNTYLRLTIPQCLPDDCKKVLYMDGDIVVEKDIAPLWRNEVKNHYVLAAQDFGAGYVASPYGLPGTYEKIGLASDTPLFNAGVMIINLERWRQENTVDKVLNYTNVYKKHIQYADQDGLNAVIGGQWGQIDMRWNVQVGAVQAFETLPESPHKEKMRPEAKTLINSAYMLHFTGGRKPWNAMLTNPVRKRFDIYLKRSRWFETPREYNQWRFKWLKKSIKLVLNDVKKKFRTKL